MRDGWWQVPRGVTGLSFSELVGQRVAQLAKAGQLAGTNQRVVRHETRRWKAVLLGEPPPELARRCAELGSPDDLAVVRATVLKEPITHPSALAAAAGVVALATEIALAYCLPGAVALNDIGRKHGFDRDERKRLEDKASLAARDAAKELFREGVEVLGSAAAAERIRADVEGVLEEEIEGWSAPAAPAVDDDSAARARSREHDLWLAVYHLARRRRRYLFPTAEEAEELMAFCAREAAMRLADQDPDDLDERVVMAMLSAVIRWRRQDEARKRSRVRDHELLGDPDPDLTHDRTGPGDPERMLDTPTDVETMISKAGGLLRELDEWEADRGAELVDRIPPRGRSDGRRASEGQWARWVRERWADDRGALSRPPRARSATVEQALPRVRGLIREAFAAVADGRTHLDDTLLDDGQGPDD